MSELVVIFLATRLHILILLIGITFALSVVKNEKKKLFWLKPINLK
jgi:hypothetical protein